MRGEVVNGDEYRLAMVVEALDQPPCVEFQLEEVGQPYAGDYHAVRPADKGRYLIFGGDNVSTSGRVLACRVTSPANFRHLERRSDLQVGLGCRHSLLSNPLEGCRDVFIDEAVDHGLWRFLEGAKAKEIQVGPLEAVKLLVLCRLIVG